MSNPNSAAQRSFAAEPYDSVAAVLASKQITSDLAGQRIFTKDGYCFEVVTSGGTKITAGGAHLMEITRPYDPSRAEVATITIPPDVQSIQTSGYYSPGDGGGATYKRVASEPTHDGKVQSADGAWWEISEINPNVMQFGARGDGSTNDAAALQASIDYAGFLNLPAGIFNCGSTLTCTNKDLSIFGVGKEQSRIKWTSDVDGIYFLNNENAGVSSNARKNINIRDVSLTTAVNSTSKFAIKAVGTNNTLVGDASTVSFTNVDIRGEDHYAGNVNKWHKGVYLEDMGNVSLKGIRVFHSNTGGVVTGSAAFHFKAVTGTNLRLFMNDVHTLWHETALQIEGNGSTNRAEGIYISNYEFVGPQYGVKVNGSELHALELSNGHMDCERNCVLFDPAFPGSSGVKIMGNYLQLGDKATGVAKPDVLLKLQGVKEGSVIGNYIFCDNSVDQIGVQTVNGANIVVTANTFDGHKIGCEFPATAANCREFGNTFKNTKSGGVEKVYNSSSCTMDLLEPTSLMNGSNGLTVKSGVVVVTMDANGKGVITLPRAFRQILLGFSVNNNNASVSGEKAVSTSKGESSVSQLVFYVRPIPTGNIEVQYTAFGI